ncbi:hypothetical protein [Dendronalium sp. ChiSLP03b]|uniref:hypothetical protein n=1 Tax=Dendronalium sp. ChiSLP03b TaxID=3075381 RepID=UPI002AD4BAF8|nr:hypothetical protein [Dendronalium sp. ChiSLP03b]MDZ8205422.1 hypothetical protein [Dendronalium sp. ChiSLP03b]
MQDCIQDYQLMAKWLTDEDVLEFYEGRDNPFLLERIIETYQPMVMRDDPVIPCLIDYHNIPIGYIQYFSLNDLPESDRQMYHLKKLIMSMELTCLSANQTIGIKELVQNCCQPL